VQKEDGPEETRRQDFCKDEHYFGTRLTPEDVQYRPATVQLNSQYSKKFIII
jgi:hypothetical protein